MSKRISKDTAREISEIRKSGVPIKELAKRFGISLTSAKLILRKSGTINMPSRLWMKEFEDCKVGSGLDAALVEKFKLLTPRQRSVVIGSCETFMRENAEYFKYGYRSRISKIDIYADKIIEMRNSGKTIQDISNELGVSCSAVGVMVKKISSNDNSDDWMKDFANYEVGRGGDAGLVERYNKLGSGRKSKVFLTCHSFVDENKIPKPVWGNKKTSKEVADEVKTLSASGKSLNYISSKLGISKGTASKYADIKHGEKRDWIEDFKNYKIDSGENKELVERYLKLENYKKSKIRFRCDVFFIENKEILKTLGTGLDLEKINIPKITKCETCGEDDKTKFYSGQISICKKCRNKIGTNKKKIMTDTVKKEMGGKCVRCGYDEFLCGLDFHHLRDKDHDYGNFNLKKLREEVKKCALLCAPCHRALHSGLWDISDVNQKLL